MELLKERIGNTVLYSDKLNPAPVSFNAVLITENYHFRNKPEVQGVSMEIVTDIAKDLILPIDFDSENHEPNLDHGCGDMCKYKIAHDQGETQFF